MSHTDLIIATLLLCFHFQMYSDLQINQGTIKTAEGYTGPVYFYLYNYLSKVTWSSVFGDCSIPLGKIISILKQTERKVLIIVREE